MTVESSSIREVSPSCEGDRALEQEFQFGQEKSIPLPQFKSKRIVQPSHLDSYQIYNLFNPARGIRDEMARKGIIPRDHRKANIAAIALKSAKLHASKEAQCTENSEGLVLGSKQANGKSLRHRISKVRNQRDVPAEPSDTSDSASTMTESTQANNKNTEKVDFMARNILDLASAAAAGRKKRDSKVPEVPANENYGKVPA